MDKQTVSIILILDMSGSMYGGKMKSMEKAVHFFVESLRQVVLDKTIEVAVISYGKEVLLELPFTPVLQVNERALSWQAGGASPLSKALIEAHNLMKERLSSIVLFSDGIADDIGYKRVIGEFSSQALLYAVPIGYDVDEHTLLSFTGIPERIFSPWEVYTLGETVLIEMLGEYVHETIR